MILEATMIKIRASQSGPSGNDIHSGGHEQQRGKRGGMNSKGAIGGYEVIIY